MLFSAQCGGAGESVACRESSGSCLYQALQVSRGLHPPEQDGFLYRGRGDPPSGPLYLRPVGLHIVLSYTPNGFGHSVETTLISL